MAESNDAVRYDNYQSIFNESFERVLGIDSDKDHFFDLFYEIFIDSSEKVAAKFENTDMERQKVVVRSSLYHMMHFYAAKESSEYMDQLAESHGKSAKNIEPELYDLWLEAMIETLKECDPQYGRKVELAWRVVLAPGIAFMRFHYDI